MPHTFYFAKALRRQLTPAERQLWARLRKHQLGDLHFRRQYALEAFVLDLCCVEGKLVIEVDGPSHTNQPEYDAARITWLEAQG